jgi:hypothetical protein
MSSFLSSTSTSLVQLLKALTSITKKYADDIQLYMPSSIHSLPATISRLEEVIHSIKQ